MIIGNAVLAPSATAWAYHSKVRHLAPWKRLVNTI